MNDNEYLKWIMLSIKNRSAFNSDFRVTKAKEQSEMEPVSKEKIVKHVNEFLQLIDIEAVSNPVVNLKNTEKRRIDYANIAQKNQLKDRADIVWIKFTTDGYISVIGTSCDISFSNKTKGKTSSGHIIEKLGKEWDDSLVLIFPLKNIPHNLNRSDIESGIGNYLISKKVPILDFYSHNY